MHLGVRDGLEVVYVETLRARAEYAVSSRVGDRWPMHATGTGLVLLAYAGAELRDQVLSSPLERFTPLTLTDPVELRRRLARILTRTSQALSGRLAGHRGTAPPH